MTVYSDWDDRLDDNLRNMQEVFDCKVAHCRTFVYLMGIPPNVAKIRFSYGIPAPEMFFGPLSEFCVDVNSDTDITIHDCSLSKFDFESTSHDSFISAATKLRELLNAGTNSASQSST